MYCLLWSSRRFAFYEILIWSKCGRSGQTVLLGWEVLKEDSDSDDDLMAPGVTVQLGLLPQGGVRGEEKGQTRNS